MADFKLNENGDLDITNDTFSLTSDKKQRLSIRMKTVLGEWFLDNSIGLPYFQKSITESGSKSAIDMIFRDHINQSDVVDRVISFVSELNRSTRFYSYQSDVQLSSEEIVNIKDGVLSG